MKNNCVVLTKYLELHLPVERSQVSPSDLVVVVRVESVCQDFCQYLIRIILVCMIDRVLKFFSFSEVYLHCFSKGIRQFSLFQELMKCMNCSRPWQPSEDNLAKTVQYRACATCMLLTAFSCFHFELKLFL